MAEATPKNIPVSDESQHDPLYDAAVECVVDAGGASTILLQRRLHLGYARAAHIIDQMEEAGIIGSYNGSAPRAILPPYAKGSAAASPPAEAFAAPAPDPVLEAILAEPDLGSAKSPQKTPQPRRIESPSAVTLTTCDHMEGHAFEELCAEVLKANGFTQVRVTRASGDYGVDVLAQKSGTPYAIQCKCYSSSVGNHAVQEAYSGAAYYGGRVPVVLTNQEFTAAAKTMASSLGVKLWGRRELARLLESYGTPAQRRKRMVLKALKIILKIVLYTIFAVVAAIFGFMALSVYLVVLTLVLVVSPKSFPSFLPKLKKK